MKKHKPTEPSESGPFFLNSLTMIYVIAFLSGLLVWIADAVLDSIFFYESTFWELLIFHIPTHELYIRLLILGCFAVFGHIAAQLIKHRINLNKRLDHLNRILAAIRNVNQLITREKDRARLLSETCRMLVETRGFFNAWIALLEKSSTTVTFTTNCGFDGKFDSMRKRLDQGKFTHCISQTLDHDNLVVIEDPPSECPECPLACEYAGRSGFTRRLAFENQVYGTLSVSVPDAYAFDAEEQDLFNELVDDVSFALHRLETEEQLQRLNHIVNTIPQPMSFLSRDYRYVAVNNAYTELFKTQSSGILGKEISALFGQKVFTNEIKPRFDQCLTGECIHYEVQVDFPSKCGRWMAMSYFPYRNDKGEITGIISHGLDITERKQAEEKLHENEENLRITLHSIGDAVITTNIEGHIIRMNPVAEALTGWSIKEANGKPLNDIFNIVNSITRELSENPVQRVIETGKIIGLANHTLLISKDGSEYQIADSAAPIKTDDGSLAGVVLVFRDVTEAYRIQKTLQDNEERLRNIIEHSTNLFYAHTPDHTLTYISPQSRYFFQREPEEAMIKWTEFVTDNPVNQKGFRLTERAIETGEKQPPYELELRGREGRIIWVQVNEAPIIKDGKVAAIVGSLTDITLRKKAEKELQNSERQKNLILNSSMEMIAYYDTDLRIIWSNRASGESVGKSPEELVGEHCYQIWHQREEICPDCPVQKAKDTKLPQQGEVQSPDGRSWSLRGYPVFNENNDVIGLVEFGHEITERKRAETQLRQVQKLESVGRLAGGIAHDFNNMLGVILGHTEMILEQMDSSQPFHSDLQEVVKAAERSAGLTRQLLAFARKQTVAPKILNLNTTVEGMLKMLGRLIGEDIELEWMPAKNLWPVKIDPGQIDQLLVNLCINARDSITGIGKITIETENSSFDEIYCVRHVGFLPGEYVQLSISDNGCGMEKEVIEQVFDPFFTTKNTGEGTGLGLATVYGIVKQNEGFINVYSEPGQGSTFKIYLPRQSGKSERISHDQPLDLKKHGNETVLLVEDEPPLLKLGKKMLEKLGYRVLTAGTPGEAIELASKHADEIHLLITDVVMPEMNGRELARQLLSMYPNLKRLFMSGYTANVIAHHGVLDAGVNFIQKPFSLQSLAEKLRDVLDKE